jgi:hypothetical protein
LKSGEAIDLTVANAQEDIICIEKNVNVKAGEDIDNIVNENEKK